ncbi:MAG TPA: thymidylate synthase [Bacillota bacterium]
MKKISREEHLNYSVSEELIVNGNCGVKTAFPSTNSIDIIEESVDNLVYQGILNVLQNGVRIQARAGTALQAYHTNYTLLSSRRRLHTLRARAVTYLCRELLAYFRGSLVAADGLVQASSFWKKLTDENGQINSNYGYYVFYQPISAQRCRNQLEWVIDVLLQNKDSRRGIININQVQHKKETKDFPCTISLLFFIRDNYLCCEVNSRSTDVITGLPYDIGFFSLLTELISAELARKKYPELQPGYTMMKTNFTQIYLSSVSKVNQILEAVHTKPDWQRDDLMPAIDDSAAFLEDIYESKAATAIMKWIYQNAGLEG